jgi:hypothetical protein
MFLRDPFTPNTGAQRLGTTRPVDLVSNAAVVGACGLHTRCTGIAGACAVLRPPYAAALARSYVRRFRSKTTPGVTFRRKRKFASSPSRLSKILGSFRLSKILVSFEPED